MTADPRLVPGAATITEISYREAAELAHFGAKVLHPKTLRAVTQCGIPLWIRNTFFSRTAGNASYSCRLVSRCGSEGAHSDQPTSHSSLSVVLGLWAFRTSWAARSRPQQSVRANVLLISQSSSQNDICLVSYRLRSRERTVEALRREFARGSGSGERWSISLSTRLSQSSPSSARTCVVQEPQAARLPRSAGRISTSSRLRKALPSANFLRREAAGRQTALHAMHQEFQLGALDSRPLPVRSVDVGPAGVALRIESATASAD